MIFRRHKGEIVFLLLLLLILSLMVTQIVLAIKQSKNGVVEPEPISQTIDPNTL